MSSFIVNPIISLKQQGIIVHKSTAGNIYVILGFSLLLSTFLSFFKAISPIGFIIQPFWPGKLVFLINLVVFILHLISSIFLIMRYKYAFHFLCATVVFWYFGAFIPYVPLINFITLNFIILSAQHSIFTRIIPFIYNMIFLVFVFVCHKSLFNRTT